MRSVNVHLSCVGQLRIGEMRSTTFSGNVTQRYPSSRIHFTSVSQRSMCHWFFGDYWAV